jgi:hypothetical protein
VDRVALDPVAADRQGSQVVDRVDPLAPGPPTSEEPGRRTSAHRGEPGLVAEAARARAAEAAHTRRTVLIRSSITENAFDLNAEPVAPKKRHPPTLPAVGATLVVAPDRSQS